jgi:carotenoid cleavage dioxygenase-like enzyme
MAESGARAEVLKGGVRPLERSGRRPSYAPGFSSLGLEVRFEDLPVTGQFPAWLTGTLIRNGPGKFEVGNESYQHWFDGLAMLHKFSFRDGRVSYANRFLETGDFLEAAKQGRITRRAFATDPCRTIFGRLIAMFSTAPVDNANVNISILADRCVALAETSLPITFDPGTLRSAGVLDSGAESTGQLTTAHPHLDFSRRLSLNYWTRMGRKSRYDIVAIDDAGATRLISSLSVDRPAYMHTFAVTEHYVVLAEFPLVVNPLRLLLAGRPFIENFRWKPERGTRFWVVSKDDHRLVRTHQAGAFFAFHHVNAFERGDDIMLDVSAYPDPGIIKSFYLKNLRSAVDIPTPEVRRYHLAREQRDCGYEVLSSQNLELPRINYWRNSAREYQYVYGAGARRRHNFIDELVKVNVQNGGSRTWFEDDSYPGEPVFVAAPGATREDEGVILAVVFDGKEGTSFLLALDAETFQELGRAVVPHHIPFGFHGQYLTGAATWEERHLHR